MTVFVCAWLDASYELGLLRGTCDHAVVRQGRRGRPETKVKVRTTSVQLKIDNPCSGVKSITKIAN